MAAQGFLNSEIQVAMAIASTDGTGARIEDSDELSLQERVIKKLERLFEGSMLNPVALLNKQKVPDLAYLISMDGIPMRAGFDLKVSNTNAGVWFLASGKIVVGVKNASRPTTAALSTVRYPLELLTTAEDGRKVFKFRPLQLLAPMEPLIVHGRGLEATATISGEKLNQYIRAAVVFHGIADKLVAKAMCPKFILDIESFFE